MEPLSVAETIVAGSTVGAFLALFVMVVKLAVRVQKLENKTKRLS